MEKIKLFSLVLPAYKQSKTIVKNINELEEVLSTLPFRSELIIVLDGRDDEASKKIKALIKKKRKIEIRLFEYEVNQGKGYAVSYGVMKAKGDVIGFIDAGLDINPSEISLMINLMEWNNADIIVGSKLHPESKVNYPIARKILSWGYRTFTHLLFGFTVRDTQVGLKIFKGKVAKDVFSKLVVKRFAFDIEVLAVAYRLGYKKIYEAPVVLDFKNGTITSSNFWRIIFWMLWDTIAVFYRINVLRYYDRK
ncbi:MAG TPA: glycosyltransferase [Patescibacteria group bacterium]|nr:glycosyltransferase [Patescibacteria group bacterium]